MNYKFEDFLPEASAELAPDAPLQDKVAALEKEVADLKVRLGDLKSSVASIDEFVRTHIARLADDAARDFAQKFKEPIQQAVEATFNREGRELTRAIFNVIVAKIKPGALK